MNIVFLIKYLEYSKYINMYNTYRLTHTNLINIVPVENQNQISCSKLIIIFFFYLNSRFIFVFKY